jgi:type I restriction enzyme S subunit
MMNNQKDIPKDWVLGELIDFCIKSKRAIVDGPFGSNLKTEHFKKEGVPVINSSFVTELTFNANEYVYVDDELFQREIRSKVVPGDIVMAKIGARCGSSAILPANHPISILSGNSLKISIDENKNSKEFVWYLLVNEYLKNQFKDCKSVGAQPAISTPHLKKLKFPKPPLPEQKAIAQVLSTADAAIHTTEKLIAQKELSKKWLMQQLLTGKRRLNSFSSEVKPKVVGQFLKEVSERNKDLKVTRVLSVTNSRGFINQSDQFGRSVASEDTSNYKIVKKGQFAYNPSRVNVGSLDLLRNYDKGILSPMYVVFSTNEKQLLADFLYFQLKTQWFYGHIPMFVQGSVRDSLSFDGLCSMKFFIPTIEEQTAISQVLQAADKEINLLKAKAEKLREQKKGLMQVLLTGKVRLKIYKE